MEILRHRSWACCGSLAVLLWGACTRPIGPNVSAPPVQVHSDIAGLKSVAMEREDGCLRGPVEQFGRYLGDWDIRDWELSADGKVWTEKAGARWNFVCVGDGLAVQDFWFPASGGMGTNLRRYDKNTESWDIAWTAKSLPGLASITAKEAANGNIVMNYVVPKKPPRRIVFYPPTAEGWNWAMQMSFDEGNTWRDVYKITATRRTDAE